MRIKSDCLRCKGRLWCNLSYCPIVKRVETALKITKNIDVEFAGTAPSVFVGHFGYPNVNVGILSTTEKESSIFDAPRKWSSLNLDIPTIIELRSSLINSRFKADIKNDNKLLEIGKEIAMTSKPVSIDISLKKKPIFKINFFRNEAPIGPTVPLKKVELTENPKIDKKVEYVVSDYYLKASDAISYLHKRGFDENLVVRLLSIGNLGYKVQRRLVPTRWAITATDDIIAKNIMKEIKNFNTIVNYSLFFGSYLGNYYLVLMLPQIWCYELFEMYMPKTSWNINDKIEFTTDYEGHEGRKDYAKNCAGGYYSVRLAVLEKLKEMKRQASVIVLRIITDDYATPLGVWVTREAARKALSNKPLEFNSMEEMLNSLKRIVKDKWNYDLENILKRSKVIEGLKFQKRLTNFL